MKIYIKQLLFLVLLLSATKSWSQSYMITNGTVNTCTGTFYDTGGGAGNYGNSQNFTYTICSDNGQPVYVDFKEFNLENGFDILKIYDGPTTTYPLIGQFTGTNSPRIVTTSGGTCLTFLFTSDNATTQIGWTANIGCGVAPTPIKNTTYTSGAGTYTVPCGVNNITVMCYGAGGGGGPDATVGGNSGGGGGGGGYTESTIAVTPSQTINYSVGTGGSGGPTSATPGSNTTFGSLSATGGQRGESGSAGGMGGPGGVGSGGTVNMTGNSGMNGNTSNSGAGGNSAGVIGFGAGGASISVDGMGINGSLPGGGGGGAFNTCCGSDNGGFGGNGLIDISYNDPSPIILGQLLGPQTLCQNQAPAALNISASGASLGFQWYSNTSPSKVGATLLTGANSSSYSPSTTSPGTLYYFCIVSGTCGPNDTSLVSGPILVHPTPTANAGVDVTICSGSSTTVFGNAAGGTPSYSYSWWTAAIGGTQISTSQNYNTPVLAPGPNSYYLEVADANTCVSTRDLVIVTANPLPIMTSASTNSICEGFAINHPLTADIGGTTFSWVANNNANTTGESTTPIGSSTINNTISSISTVNETLQYTVTPTANGCPGPTQTVTITIKPQPNLTPVTNQTLCNGSLTSAISFISDVGGSTFSWTNSNPAIGIPASGTTNIASTVVTNGGGSAISGNFSAQAIANGCNSAPQAFIITVNPSPAVSISAVSNPICSGSSTNLTAGGANTYVWSPGASLSATTGITVNASPTIATTYTVVGTNTITGCQGNSTISISVNPTSVGGTITGGTSPACSGSNSGTLTLSGSTGSVLNWEFSTNGGASWTNIANTTVTQAYTNLITTTIYRAVVQSGVCASAISATKTIVVNNPPTASSAGADQNFCNQTTTTLSANTPVSGTGSWSVFSGSAVVTSPSVPNSGVTGLTIGASSTLVWTIANSPCLSSSDTIVITSNPSPSITGILSGCIGSTTSLSGTGTPHGSIPWSSSVTSNATVSSIGLVSAIASGTTNITYTDINNCATTSTFTINANPPASITAGGPTTFCSGGNVTLNANVGPYTYQWMHGATPIGGATSSSFVATNAGNHTVVITDIGTSCNATSNMININIEANPTGTTLTTDISCNGYADGIVNVSPSGTGPFMYSYDNGAFITNSSQSSLAAGSHTVNVQSGAGCISSDILYTINEPTAIIGSLITSTNPSCFGFNDGDAIVTATGGNGTYNYSINASAFLPSNSFTGLTAGAYNVDIEDGNGCVSSSPIMFNLNNPTPISVNLTPGDVSCFGGNNGSITANAIGGTGGFQFSLDNFTFQGSNVFTNLTSNSYTVYVKDISGCLVTNSTSISQPASNFLISSSGISYICSGQAWGETFSSSGGFGAITYSWAAQPPTNVTGASSGSGNTISEILTATTFDPNTPETVIYDLNAIDQNGCTANSTHTVYVHPLPPVNIVSDINPLCISSIANLTASSTSDFFGWNATTDLTIINNTSATFAPSSIGNFVVTYTVAMNTGANCTNSSAITLTVTSAPTAPTLAANSPVCAGSPINLTSNTIIGATYSWSGPNGFTSTLEDPTIPFASSANIGTYTCTVDVTGCTSTSTVNVAVNPKPQAIIPGVSTTFCANETFTLDGSSSVPNSSAITNYQWQLNGVDIPGANSVTYMGNTPGNYKLVVTNDLGCMDTTLTPNVANADAIPVPVINGATSFCSGNNITLDAFTSSAGGASVIDNYEWLHNGITISSGASNDTYIVSLGGDYQLIILNSNGCKDTSALYTVTENPIPGLPSVTPDPVNVCVGGSTNISINSPVGGSIYNWASINAETSVSSTTGNLNTVNGLAPGIASITVTETNAAGCIGPTYSVTVNVSNPPTAVASFTSNDTICYNGNASVALNLISGGTYNWTSSIGNTSTSQSVTFNNITTAGNVEFYGTVTDGAGCTSSQDTIVLFVRAQPITPVISNPSSVCPNQPFTLFVNPIITGADYYWTDPAASTQNGINLTSITIPSATAVTAGPYVVNYIDNFGCTSPYSSLYNQPIDPKPIVSITGLTTICSGNSTTLSATTSIGTPIAYQWFKNGLAISGETASSLLVSTPGNYNVEIILPTGCFDSAAVATTVNVSSGPIVTASPLSSTICAGNSATIDANGAISYSWDNGATAASITVNPTVTSYYIVTGTDASGCTNKDTAVVVVNSLPPTPLITAGSITECAGTAISLSSNSSLPNTWINTSTLAVIGTTQTISHTETIAGTYNFGVYVTDANSCNSGTATIAITFNPCLTNLISDNVSTNANTPISGNFLTNDGNPSMFTTVSIVNGPVNGAITVSSNGNFTYTPATNFSGYNMVVVQVCDATPTCLNDTIYIIVNPNASGDTYTVNGLSTPNTIIGNVLLNDAGSGISGNVSLVSSVSNGIIVVDTLGNFTYTPNAGFCGTDLFTYNVCDQNGLCANAGVNLIVTCDSTVTTTTGFSPNGDGVNDNWIIQGIETTQNTVTVFDRWGNQVISFINYNNTSTAWDGKNSNGVELPAGTYFYSIDIPDEKSKKGWVEITK